MGFITLEKVFHRYPYEVKNILDSKVFDNLCLICTDSLSNLAYFLIKIYVERDRTILDHPFSHY